MKKLIYRIFLFFLSPRIRISFIKDDDVHFNTVLNKIYFNPYQIEDNGFMRHIKEVHEFNENYSIFLLVFLHEVGHYFTYIDDIEAFDELKGIDFKDFKTSKEIQDLYYNSIFEWDATEWAIEYIKKHPIRCKLLDKILRKNI